MCDFCGKNRMLRKDGKSGACAKYRTIVAHLKENDAPKIEW